MGGRKEVLGKWDPGKEVRMGSGRDGGQGASGKDSQLPRRVGLPAKEAQLSSGHLTCLHHQ